MKLEDQCCTLQQAKRLKELGVEQISYFVWGERGVITEAWSVEGYEDTFHSAYNVAELGLMLPGMIGDIKLVQWHIASNDSRWALSYGIQYRYKDNDPIHHVTFPLHCVFGNTEAKARAELLICLLADGKVTAEEINKRLTDK